MWGTFNWIMLFIWSIEGSDPKHEVSEGNLPLAA
jgi:hypothetical protein